MRTAADVAPLRDALVRARHLVVIGGGFIGGEIASAAVALAAPVTLIELAAAGPLAPVLGEQAGERVTALHRAAGVDVRAGVAGHRRAARARRLPRRCSPTAPSCAPTRSSPASGWCRRSTGSTAAR